MPLDIDSIRRLCPEHDVHYFESVDSTMTAAAKLAVERAPHGTIVVADEQTAGVGRLGRSWRSCRDLGIYCSVLLQLPIPPESLPLMTLVLGLATVEAIEKSTHLACDLRWPNDILINERKVAGILAQLVEDYVIAGIGVNVNHTSFPADLRIPATSLRIESDSIQSREDVLINLVHSLDAFCSMLVTEGPEWIPRAFVSASSYAIDRRVLIEDDGRKGVTVGIDENGFLLVRLDSGCIEKIAAGGVRPDS